MTPVRSGSPPQKTTPQNKDAAVLTGLLVTMLGLMVIGGPIAFSYVGYGGQSPNLIGNGALGLTCVGSLTSIFTIALVGCRYGKKNSSKEKKPCRL